MSQLGGSQHLRTIAPTRNTLLMDNVVFHLAEVIGNLLDGSPLTRGFLPPYSPHLNPIEEYFSELKGVHRMCGKTWVEFPFAHSEVLEDEAPPKTKPQV